MLRLAADKSGAAFGNQAMDIPIDSNADMSYLFLHYSKHGCASTQETAQMLEETYVAHVCFSFTSRSCCCS
jgi:hypothetical protein